MCERGVGVAVKIIFLFPLCLIKNVASFFTKIWSLCDKISENNFIFSSGKLRGTSFKQKSWVYQKINFDLMYRQINITTGGGLWSNYKPDHPFSLELLYISAL